jgi:hypothetical protein
MKIGGGGREVWLVVVPIVGLVFLTTMLLGGPEDVLMTLEHTFYAAWDRAAVFFRR